MLREKLKSLILAHEDSLLKDLNFFIVEVDGGGFLTNEFPKTDNKLLHQCTCITFTNELPFIEINIEGIDETFYPEDVGLNIFSSKKYYATLSEEDAKTWSYSIRMYTAEGVQSDLEKQIKSLQEELEVVNGYIDSLEDERKETEQTTTFGSCAGV